MGHIKIVRLLLNAHKPCSKHAILFAHKAVMNRSVKKAAHTEILKLLADAA